MERDFELEYRELKQNETPDLWNRIEAGLSEKKVTTMPWKRLGLLAAACLCVVILFPAVMTGLINFSKSNSSGSSADTASSAESADSLTGAVMESESSAVFDNGSMAGGSDTAVMEGAEALEEAAPEAAATEAEISKDVMPEATDGQILEGAVVQILQADETGEETVYQAVVLEADMDAVLKEDMQIELICNDETQYDFIHEPREENELEKEETYEVSLQYEQDKLVVLKAAKKN